MRTTKTFLRRVNNEELVTTKGHPVQIEGYEGIGFFVYYDGRRWGVAEYSTGLDVTRPTALTKEEAVAIARDKIEKHEALLGKTLQEIIERALVRVGPLPQEMEE